MRLKRAQIFGFGKWIDTVFDFNDESFICFYGKNESGKSTLQQFIFYMLFGLQPHKLARFKPKFSNRIGGTLTIAFPEIGIVTIERVDNHFRILLPDGNAIEDEAWLEERLHGLQRETYQAIYGFSALDLMKLHEIKKTELSDLLFSVGLTGSTAIYEVERRIARRLDELFKKAGRKPIINKQITKVNKLRKEMLETQKEAMSYSKKINLQSKIEARLNHISEMLTEKKTDFSLSEKVLQFLPQIHTFRETRKALEQFANMELDFPENGLERYEYIKERLIPLQAELNTDNKTLKQYEGTISELKEKLIDEPIYEEIMLLLEKNHHIENIKHNVKDIGKEISEATISIEHELEQLQVTEEAVIRFEAPFHLETTWQQLIDDAKNLQLEKDYLIDEHRVLEQKEERLLSEQEKYEQKFIGFEQLNELERDVLHKQKHREELSSLELLHKWETERKRQVKNGMFLTVIPVVILFVLSFMQSNIQYAVFSAVLVFVLIFQAVNIKKISSRLHKLTNDIGRLQRKQKGDNDFSTYLKEQQALAEQIRATLQSVKQVRIKMLQLEEKKNHFALKEEKHRRFIEEEREKYPILQQIELPYWIQYLHHIKQLKSKLKYRDELREKYESLGAEINRFNDEVERIGRFITNRNERVTLAVLQSVAKNFETTVQEIKQYENLREEMKSRIVLTEEEVNLFTEQMKELFSVANVQDEDGFYYVARKREEKIELQKRFMELKEQLTTVFPQASFVEVLETEMDEYTLHQKVELLQTEINELEEEETELLKQLATLQVEINQLESSDDYSYTNHLFEIEREHLNVLAEQWSMVKVAQAMLQNAKQTYQQKYLTDVIDYTSRYFSHLTVQKYISVYEPTETTPFQVEGADKIRYTVEELSKGTIDQLYVALRLAISKVMSDKFVVPLMIDDAFIHFDGERTLLAIKLLEKIAKEQQVILYTCRKFVADSINEAKSMQLTI